MNKLLKLRWLRIFVIAFVIGAILLPSLPAFTISIPKIDAQLPQINVSWLEAPREWINTGLGDAESFIARDLHLGPQPAYAANDRYWVGGAGSWNSTSHWSTSDGGAGGASIPGSTNDVHFTASSGLGAGGTITVTGGGQTCHNFEITAGVGTLTWSINYGISVYGNWTGVGNQDIRGQISLYGAGATWTQGGTNFGDTSTTIVTQTGSSYMVMDYMIAPGGVDNTLGAALDTTTHSAYIQVGGPNYVTNACSPYFKPYGAASTYYEVRLYGDSSGDAANSYSVTSITNSFTCTNLILQATNKNDVFSFAGNPTVTGTFTCTGTPTVRGKIVSSAHPTQRTITAAAVSVTSFDFQDIIGAGAGNWNLASSDTIDYSNNNGITFTYPYNANEDIYWTGLQGTGSPWNWGDEYNWSNTSGGVGGMKRHYVPQSTNNVHFDSNANFTVGAQTIKVDGDLHGSGLYKSGYSKNLDFTGSNAIAGAQINCCQNWPGAYGNMYTYGSLTLVPGMTTLASGQVSSWNFMGSGSITTAGVYWASGFNPIINSTGTYTLQDDWHIGDGTSGTRTDWTYTAGTLNTNGHNLIFTNQAGTMTFNGGGQTYYGVQFLNNTGVTINGANTFTNLSQIDNQPTNFGVYLKFAANQVINGTLTLTGYNGSHRLQVGSTVVGTQRQITVNGGQAVTNCDISDIAWVGSVTGNISAGNNSDFGDNLGITFSQGYYQYWVGNSGNWSDVTHWASSSGGMSGSGRVPLIQDIAVFDTNSFSIPGRTVTIDVTNISGIDTSAVTNNPTITKSGSVDMYRGFNLGAAGGMTWSVTSTYMMGSNTITMAASNAYTFTGDLYIQTNPAYMTPVNFNTDFTIGGILYLKSGILCLQGFNVTAKDFDSSSTASARAINLSTGIFTLNDTAATTKFNVASSNFNVYDTSSTIVLTNSGTNGQTFAGAGLSYGNLTIAGAGNYTLTFNSSNTFKNMLIDRSQAAKTIAGSYTETVTGLFSPTSGTTVLAINHVSFSQSTGQVVLDYLNFTSGSNTCIASGGATFYAGAHSLGSPQTGWNFSSPVTPAITTVAANQILDTSAALNGNLTALGGYGTVYVYFHYGVDPTMTAYSSTSPMSARTTTGAYSIVVTGLAKGTTYYFQAIGSDGTTDLVGGTVLSFIGGNSLAGVTALTPTGVANNGMTLQGNLTSVGGSTVTYVGFVWDTASHADPGSTTPAKTSYTGYYTNAGSFALGMFSYIVSGLSANTTYYIRALAFNSMGWVYSAEISQATSNAVPIPTTYRAIYSGPIIAPTGAPSTYNPITLNAVMPSQFYTEGDTSGIPGAGIITAIFGQSGTPESLWWFPFIYGLIAIVSLLFYELTTSKGQVEGSLLTQFVVIEAMLVFFGVLGTAGVSGMIPLFGAFIFPIPAVAIIMSKKHYGWG